MHRLYATALLALCFLAPLSTHAYPIDGYAHTGIKRLDFYRLAHGGKFPNGRRQPPGGILGIADVDIRAIKAPPTLPAADAVLSAKLVAAIGEDAHGYGVALIDLTDPENPVYAEHNADYRNNTGSVGKLLVAVALFHELARAWPDDTGQRLRILRESRVIADDFIFYDHHKVPIWNVDTQTLQHRAQQKGDQGSLFEYLDWMMSASANSAASMLMKHIIALRHFGKDYPVSDAVFEKFFETHRYHARGDLMDAALREPLAALGIADKDLRQGSLFTRTGKQQVRGKLSWGTPRALATLLYQLERGAVVDEFSSREIKRMLYMTQKRIRYASHSALLDSAVYFKSGSLYSCKPEPGFVCKKYAGNKLNLLTSAAIIEAPAQQRRRHYVVTVMSNVLRKNSAFQHQALAARIHALMMQDEDLPVE